MARYELTTRPGAPGYIFATREDGQLFEIYTQYGDIEPRIEDATERAHLLEQARDYWSQPKAAPAPKALRDTSHDIPDVRAEMHAAGFGEAAENEALRQEHPHANP